MVLGASSFWVLGRWYTIDFVYISFLTVLTLVEAVGNTTLDGWYKQIASISGSFTGKYQAVALFKMW